MTESCKCCGAEYVPGPCGSAPSCDCAESGWCYRCMRCYKHCVCALREQLKDWQTDMEDKWLTATTS